MSRRVLLRLASLALAASFIAGCGSGGDNQPGFVTVPLDDPSALTTTTVSTDETTTTIARNLNLVGVCSNPVVIQLDTPLDMWALPYVHLIGPDGQGSASTYRAPLVNPDTGNPTGIDIELRTSGRLPVTGASASSVLGDPAVLFTTTNFEQVLPVEATAPVIVAAPWSRTDLALQWTAALPAMRTIADIAGTALSNPEFAPEAASYLRGSGLLPEPAKAGEIRRTVEGVPAGSTAILSRLLDIPDQAAALVSSDLPGPRAQLLADVGWEPYPHVLVVNRASAEQRVDCVRSIVPLVQFSLLRLSLQPKLSSQRLALIGEKMGLALDQSRLAAQMSAALSLDLLATGSQASPIAADPALARLVQIARSQKTAAVGAGKNLRLPSDLPSELGALVDRSFIDSDLKYTYRDKPEFGVDVEAG